MPSPLLILVTAGWLLKKMHKRDSFAQDYPGKPLECLPGAPRKMEYFMNNLPDWALLGLPLASRNNAYPVFPAALGSTD